MDKDQLHDLAREVAKRILYGTQQERYELGVAEPGENARVLDDLVELAEQLLHEERINWTRQTMS